MLEIIEMLMFTGGKSLSATDGVHLQLQDDYPDNAISWVKDYNWSWPHPVSQDLIDYSNKKDWNYNPSKVEKFKNKITRGIMKPAVLVKPKGSDLYIVTDGHHRCLASSELGRPQISWTTSTDSKKGPWDSMHDQQVHKKVKMSNYHLDTIMLAVDSLAKANTPEPLGPGELWHKKDKSMHLPFYVQHVAHALQSSGHSESEAIQMAIGIIKRWSTGSPSGVEHKIDDNTKAAARKALVEWQSLKARAKTTK